MKVNYTLKPATTEKEIQQLSELATEIWHECYADLLSAEQIDYMLDKFQSPTALKTAIFADKFEYFMLKKGEMCIGYVAIHEEQELLFLSKLYLKKDYRSKGLGNDMLATVIETAEKRKKDGVYLTVNRNNNEAIRLYTRLGFLIEREHATDIGKGFEMDDYVMVYRFCKT